jgi:uncharacterized membrane protein
VHYDPKFKWGTSGVRTSVTVRLVPGDLALLDALVAAEYKAPIEPDGNMSWTRADRGSALRRAIREAADREKITAAKKHPLTERERKVLSALEQIPAGARPAVIAASIGLTKPQIYRPLGELERAGLARKDGELWYPIQGALPEEGDA